MDKIPCNLQAVTRRKRARRNEGDDFIREVMRSVRPEGIDATIGRKQGPLSKVMHLDGCLISEFFYPIRSKTDSGLPVENLSRASSRHYRPSSSSRECSATVEFKVVQFRLAIVFYNLTFWHFPEDLVEPDLSFLCKRNSPWLPHSKRT
ncbi:hypothetical protein KM043_013145 [Ampulex compressa]|nr:hypothetical protein KM043_013145 [Ampulex compressa]